MRLTYALLFHDMGIPVLPCYRESKAILKGYGPSKDRTASREFLYTWIKDKNNNYALAAGHSGLVVLDFDDYQVYQDWAAAVGKLADTFTVTTHRGYHVYYLSDDVRSWRSAGVEVLGKGKAVIGPYSLHPSGELYLPVNPPEIRSITTVSDFPLLSTNRPVNPKPPKKAPDHIKGLRGGISPVKRIKSTWTVLDALEQLHPDSFASIKGSGRWLSALCPFHDDHRSSLWIDTERKIFGCHACGVHGDVINLVAETYQTTPGAAIRLILKKKNLDLQGVK